MLHLKDLLTNAKFVIGKLATLCSEEFMFQYSLILKLQETHYL